MGDLWERAFGGTDALALWVGYTLALHLCAFWALGGALLVADMRGALKRFKVQPTRNSPLAPGERA